MISVSQRHPSQLRQAAFFFSATDNCEVPLFPQMFLHASLQKNKCLSKLPVPPPRETVARG